LWLEANIFPEKLKKIRPILRKSFGLWIAGRFSSPDKLAGGVPPEQATYEDTLCAVGAGDDKRNNPQRACKGRQPRGGS
jgi:hypothetical protein